MNRAYSFLHVKAVDGEQRKIAGIATTPTPDRTGDVVEPLGVQYKNPLPLLLYHDSKKPVGTVRFKKPTADGIEFEASLPRIDEPGTVRDRIEEAWTSIKQGLLAGVSIGFRSIEQSFNKETGGFHFLKSEVLELSLVAIPAQPDARIELIKSLDIGRPDLSVTGADVPQTPPAVVGIPRVKRRTPAMPKPIADQIKDWEATRATTLAERDAIFDKANDAGLTLDANEQESYDTLDAKVKDIDRHLVLLKAREEENRAAAKPVETKAEQMPSRTPVRVEVKSRMPEGLEFAAAILCKANAYIEMQRGNFVSALDIAKQRYPDYLGIQQYIQKTAVAGGTTSDSNWATALLEPNQVLVNEFLEFLRPRTLVGRIPGLRRVPFNVTFQSQTSAASASWVGQGKAKPLTKFNSTTTSLAFTKIAAIAVITDELARFSRPGAEQLVRDELARAVIERMDLDFVDPDKAVSSGVNPASITNGVTPGNTAGTSAANVLTDVQGLVNAFIELKYDIGSLVLLMPNSLAFATSLMLNSSGFRSFPEMTIDGGSIGGVPVITSQYLANLASYGNMVVCLSANNIALADDGAVSIDVSRETSLQMDDAPTIDATAGTGASMVSMFQTNSVAIRAERVVNWKKLRSTAVTFLDDVNWGSVGSPR